MQASDEITESLTVAIVGAGAVGRSLGAAIQSSRHQVVAVVSRTQTSASAAAAEFDIEVGSTNLADCLSADLILICVPDATIPMVVDILSAFGSKLAGRQVLHTSGLVTSDVLAPLRAESAQVASFHPLQTFSRNRLIAFHNLPVAVESTTGDTGFAEKLASDLGARPFVIPAENKAAYHLAAAVLSNYSVVLAKMAEEILNQPGMPSLPVFERLVESTWANVFSRGPAASLTGPVSRGDTATVQSHLEVFAADQESLRESYALLARRAAELALESGTISRDQFDDVRKILDIDGSE